MIDECETVWSQPCTIKDVTHDDFKRHLWAAQSLLIFISLHFEKVQLKVEKTATEIHVLDWEGLKKDNLLYVTAR